MNQTTAQIIKGLLVLALGAGGMWLILRPRRGVLTGAWFV